MEGIVKGYTNRFEAPWPPRESSEFFRGPSDQAGAGSKQFLYDETDLKHGYHLNADSTDYIYKASDQEHSHDHLSHGVQLKPSSTKLLVPDYDDFDYVDIKGSSGDSKKGRSFTRRGSKTIDKMESEVKPSSRRRAGGKWSARDVSYAREMSPESDPGFVPSIRRSDASQSDRDVSYARHLSTKTDPGFIQSWSPSEESRESSPEKKQKYMGII